MGFLDDFLDDVFDTLETLVSNDDDDDDDEEDKDEDGDNDEEDNEEDDSDDNETDEQPHKISEDILSAQKFLRDFVNDYGEEIFESDNAHKFKTMISQIDSEHADTKDVLMIILSNNLGGKFLAIQDSDPDVQQRIFADSIKELKGQGMQKERATDIVSIVASALGMTFNSK